MGQISLQLYSVREATAKDFLETLRNVAEMGYDGVQFAGFFETPAKELKKVLDESGIVPAGSHMGYDTLLGDQLEATLAYNREIGNDLIICPFLAPELRKNADDYKKVAESLNQIGETCKQHGFTFGYHNHNFEFEEVDGQRGFDILFENTDPELVKMELDCFWVTHAGYSPQEVIEKYGDRVVSLHMKDMKQVDGKKVSTEVGNGELDLSGLLEIGQQQGVHWFTVEQEDFERDPLASAEINVRNLRELVKK
ncbi:MAG TPA: sugar phosphate isomerase/epimerase [Bacillales bacterium]|nr:sugar phosphate isomerase/epimerase [Bacillales bacterium]